MNLARMALPPRTRPNARLTVLDVTKWFGETSGGVRTYLHQKGEFVRRHPDLRQVLVIPGPKDEIVDGDGVRVYRLRGPRIPTQAQYRFLLATRSLHRIVEHEQPNVIEVGSQIFVPWVTRLANRHRRTPLVGFYHGNLERNIGASLSLAPSSDTVVRATVRGYLRMVDRLFAARLAASEALAGDLRAAGIRNITRVRLGVDASAFHPARRHLRNAVRAERGIPQDAPIVMYCGRIAPEKDIPWLVRAWPRLAMLSRAWLVLVGDGPLKTPLQNASVAQRARIIWLPFESDRERLADLLASADLLVSPGPIETFGLSALEAMACGTPVLSVNCGAGSELVRHSGAGRTYRIRDDDDFARTLTGLLADDTEAMGRCGRRYAEREHGWDRAFSELFAFYERLATA